MVLIMTKACLIDRTALFRLFRGIGASFVVRASVGVTGASVVIVLRVMIAIIAAVRDVMQPGILIGIARSKRLFFIRRRQCLDIIEFFAKVLLFRRIVGEGERWFDSFDSAGLCGAGDIIFGAMTFATVLLLLFLLLTRLNVGGAGIVPVVGQSRLSERRMGIIFHRRIFREIAAVFGPGQLLRIDVDGLVFRCFYAPRFFPIRAIFHRVDFGCVE
mmetsp:Transcript_6231/g.13450  ORF Transcript_6231/g.13450 Transcript_6231/m.13450 type:complete len:216 (-) Transcript_6231:1568-2215(-)